MNAIAWTELLDAWGKFAAEVGVPAFILVLFMLLTFFALYKFVANVLKPILDRWLAKHLELVDKLLQRLEEFGIELKGVSAAVQAIREDQARAEARHEDRLQHVEAQLDTIHSALGDHK